jgi:hypothetical protein
MPREVSGSLNQRNPSLGYIANCVLGGYFDLAPGISSRRRTISAIHIGA